MKHKARTFRNRIYVILGLFLMLFLAGCGSVTNLLHDILNDSNTTEHTYHQEYVIGDSGELVNTDRDDHENVKESIPEETEERTIEESEDSVKESLDYKETQAIYADGIYNRYYYNLLTDTEKLWYADMLSALISMEDDVELSKEGNTAIGEEGIEKIFDYVLYDNPDLINVGGYSYTLHTMGDKLVKITFSGSYTMDKDEKSRKMAVIDGAVKECLKGISNEASEYEKVKYVYKYVICNTEYAANSPDNQNMYSVLANHKSVCQGYAKTTQYLLNKLDVMCTLVTGDVDSGAEGHAWNLVCIDGEYYYLDSTWGDPSYQGEDNNMMPVISYDYLNITQGELFKTHRLGEYMKVPPCTALTANYYVMEKTYFSEFDEKRVKECFDRYSDEDRESITFKLSDSYVYDSFIEEMIDNQKIFDCMNNPNGTVSYIENRDHLTLTFWLVNE